MVAFLACVVSTVIPTCHRAMDVARHWLWMLPSYGVLTKADRQVNLGDGECYLPKLQQKFFPSQCILGKSSILKMHLNASWGNVPIGC